MGSNGNIEAIFVHVSHDMGVKSIFSQVPHIVLTYSLFRCLQVVLLCNYNVHYDFKMFFAL